jgi:hypothetical protein
LIPKSRPTRTLEDLERAVRAIATEFRTDTIFIIGSQTHGFYIDGVDENTATLPAGWRTRAVVRRIEVDKRIVTAIAPSPEDLIVSKLARLDEKDRLFIEAYHSVRPLNPNVIEQLIRLTDLETPVADRACVYIRNLARKNP